MTTRFELIRRGPSPRLSSLVLDISGYRELATGTHPQRETASLVVPLIISLGAPFRIALGREPGTGDRQPSFAAGLYAGPVMIESEGAAECVQMNFTPLGAYRFFGGAIPELTARMVDIEDMLGHAGRALRQRMGETASWNARFALLEDFVAARIAFRPSAEITHAWHRLARSGGRVAISRLAADIGWSRKHFRRRFGAEIGLGPKTVARMMRFQRACATALREPETGWAQIAFDAGYADQAHLVREFAELAGETPVSWARRMAVMDQSQMREPDAFQAPGAPEPW